MTGRDAPQIYRTRGAPLPPAQVFYINMAKRTDRRANMDRQLKELFAVRPAAFKRWMWGRFEAKTPNAEAKKRYTGFVFGTLGCTLSHVAILGDPSVGDDRITVVLEDDAKFLQSHEDTWSLFERFLRSDLGKDWDLLVLGYTHYEPALTLEETSVPGVSRVFSTQSTIGYAVHPRFRATLWSKWKESLPLFPARCGGEDVVGYPGKACVLAIDQLWKPFMQPGSGHKVYGLWPRLVITDRSRSDIPEAWNTKSGGKPAPPAGVRAGGGSACGQNTAGCGCAWVQDSSCASADDDGSKCYSECCEPCQEEKG